MLRGVWSLRHGLSVSVSFSVTRLQVVTVVVQPPLKIQEILISTLNAQLTLSPCRRLKNPVKIANVSRYSRTIWMISFSKSHVAPPRTSSQLWMIASFLFFPYKVFVVIWAEDGEQIFVREPVLVSLTGVSLEQCFNSFIEFLDEKQQPSPKFRNLESSRKGQNLSINIRWRDWRSYEKSLQKLQNRLRHDGFTDRSAGCGFHPYEPRGWWSRTHDSLWISRSFSNVIGTIHWGRARRVNRQIIIESRWRR